MLKFGIGIKISMIEKAFIVFMFDIIVIYFCWFIYSKINITSMMLKNSLSNISDCSNKKYILDYVVVIFYWINFIKFCYSVQVFDKIIIAIKSYYKLHTILPHPTLSFFK